MMYEIHLYMPKLGALTPSMVEWLVQNGQRDDHPEAYWPVRKVKPRALARSLLRFDPKLIPIPGVDDDVELHYPDKELGVILYVHERGLIVFFPYMPFGVFSRIILGICYTYISFLYETLGFWSFDPQLNVISYADDFQSIEETAVLMDKIMPRLLPS
jgi:hypothetical protein